MFRRCVPAFHFLVRASTGGYRCTWPADRHCAPVPSTGQRVPVSLRSDCPPVVGVEYTLASGCDVIDPSTRERVTKASLDGWPIFPGNRPTLSSLLDIEISPGDQAGRRSNNGRRNGKSFPLSALESNFPPGKSTVMSFTWKLRVPIGDVLRSRLTDCNFLCIIRPCVKKSCFGERKMIQRDTAEFGTKVE